MNRHEESNNECLFSIIVPVLNEADRINSLIENIRDNNPDSSYEIIVVDGDSNSTTTKAIEDISVKQMQIKKGRGAQQNAGARIAKGQILLFLHADTYLPENALAKIGKVLKDNKYVGGAFDLAINSKKFWLKYVAFRASFRSRLNRIPYGDQAIFIRKDYFERIGCFKEIPLMEDVDLMRRIKKDRKKICIIDDKVITSARKWEQDGLFYTTFRNQILIILYYLGVNPEKLAKLYWSKTK